MPNQKFPHFFRRISAPFVLVFFLLLITLNLLHTALFGFDKFKQLRRQIVNFPYESYLHEKLAKIYLPINREEAYREFQLAYQYSEVLGAQTGPMDTWKQSVNEDEKIRNELEYWKQINKNFPDYNYANLKIAALNYQLGNKDEAKSIISKLKNDFLVESDFDL